MRAVITKKIFFDPWELFFKDSFRFVIIFEEMKKKPVIY